MIHDSILGTVGNTPVIRINKLAPAHVTMYVKAEAFNPMSSVKDRLALGIILDAEARGELKPGQTVVEATSGNTGIALAMVCAVRGYPFVAFMADSFSIERRKLMRFLGAKVILTPAAQRGSGMVKAAEEYSKKHGAFLTRQFDNEANPAYHRSTTGPEILQDFAGRRLDWFVTGYGTGGTLTGAGEMLKLARPDLKVCVCEPAVAALLAGKEWSPHKIQWLDPGLRRIRTEPRDLRNRNLTHRRTGQRATPPKPSRHEGRHLLRRLLGRDLRGRPRRRTRRTPSRAR